MIRSQKHLTKELIDQIIFGMENQEHEFFLDLADMLVLMDEEIDDFDASLEMPELPRYLDLPQWQSLDGFHLMELFVHKLHNPLAKVELQRILQSGKGVFRQFKDLLHQYPEVAKRWYRFKDQHMHRLITEWFSSTMETYGISFDAPDFEDTEELLLNDFDLHLGTMKELETEFPDHSWHQIFLSLYNQFCKETHGVFDYPMIEPHPNREGDVFGVLLTPSHEPVGVLWGIVPRTPEIESSEILVIMVYVVPEFRGLGAATLLRDRFIKSLHTKDILKDLDTPRVRWKVPATADYFVSSLEKIQFNVVAYELELKISPHQESEEDLDQ